MSRQKMPRITGADGKDHVVHFKWTDEQRDWIIGRMGAYHSYASIYREITDPEFQEKYSFKGFSKEDQRYESFRFACLRKVKSTEVEVARKLWLETWEGIPFATVKGRVEQLTKLIELLDDLKDNREKYSDADSAVTFTDIINLSRRILKDIKEEVNADAEREAKAASGTNIFIGKMLVGREITTELTNDMFLALYKEYGPALLGLQHWTLDALSELKSKIDEMINAKRKILAVEYEVED